jgi:uncharacterized protein
MLTLALTSAAVFAQGGYPEATDPYINDYAGLLSGEDAANVRALLMGLKREQGIEATVVTINSVGDYGTGDKTIERFATNLFNAWGIGHKERSDGVLMLVAVDDREIRIEVGSGYGESQTANMQEVINEHMIPTFKRNRYSQGIYRGARAVVGKLTGNWPEDLSIATASSSPSTLPAQSNLIHSSTNFISHQLANVSFGTLFGVAIVAFVAFRAARTGLGWYRRYRKRHCPHCQTSMVCLDEVSDDVYLDSGQKLEEELKSVNYDVWRCPGCNYHTLHNHRGRFFSSFRRCLECGYNAVSVGTTQLVPPTYSSTGSRSVTKDCRHCDYHHEEIVIVPKLTSSDDDDSGFWGSDDDDSSFWGSSDSSFGGDRSSSRGSFGGGGSSGRGASGKW